jgi:antitoxin (DNA-binding transcriptional repressor) of toxin-antitoxin stability system
MINVKVPEAEQRLDQLIEEAAAGEEVAITGSSGSVVRLVPLPREEGIPRQIVGHDLDRFIGTWTAEQEAEVLQAIEIFEQVDEKRWRQADALECDGHRRPSGRKP